MPNKNYRAGRAFEYDTMGTWRERGYSVIRAAGSHGVYDLVAFRPDRNPEFIQCKRVTSEAARKRLVKQFEDHTTPSRFFHQVITIKVKGTKASFSYTV